MRVWPLGSFVGSLIGFTLIASKVSVGGGTVGLSLEGINIAPPGSFVDWNDDLVYWKNTGSILGSSEGYREGGIFGLEIGDVDEASMGISVCCNYEFIVGRYEKIRLIIYWYKDFNKRKVCCLG